MTTDSKAGHATNFMNFSYLYHDNNLTIDNGKILLQSTRKWYFII